MSTTPISPGYYADFNGLESLKKSAQQNQPAAIREAARQFESLFTNMLLKSMREASVGESLGDSEQTQFYQNMFDQQLALQMSRGRGLGLAEHLLQQLQRTGLAPGVPAATAAPDAAAAPVAAAETPGAPAGRNVPTRAQFIQSIRPYALEAGRQLGVAAEAIMAHAALETGWGRHLPVIASGTSHNLFGVKASGDWQGPVAEALTKEYSGTAAANLRASFRVYNSAAASMRDYASLIGGNPRYADALNSGDDVAAFAKGLQRGGYATDPAYVQKLVATAAAVREVSAHAALKNARLLPITTGAETA